MPDRIVVLSHGHIVEKWHARRTAATAAAIMRISIKSSCSKKNWRRSENLCRTKAKPAGTAVSDSGALPRFRYSSRLARRVQHRRRRYQSSASPPTRSASSRASRPSSDQRSRHALPQRQRFSFEAGLVHRKKSTLREKSSPTPASSSWAVATSFPTKTTRTTSQQVRIRQTRRVAADRLRSHGT